MATRVPLSWVILLLLVGVFAFFGYHIVQASYSTQETAVNKKYVEQYEPQRKELSVEPAPVVQPVPTIPNKVPQVPGQTEEELRTPEPLQRTPPAVQYDSPEATDPMNSTAYMDAMFGDNFRHPEQMMEMRPESNTDSIVDSGLGSRRSSPGGNNPVMYAPEMAQNGGEFMQGIVAFEGAGGGGGYSML